MRIADLKETVKMALDTLRANKLRSGLTILGIVIGVMTVIIISSVVNGLNNSVGSFVQSLGSNVLFIFRFPVIGQRPTTEMLTRKQMTYEDAMAMRDLPHVVAVSPALQYTDNNAPGRSGITAIKGNGRKMQNTILDGDTPDAERCQRARHARRPLLQRRGPGARRQVTVLGSDTADELFGDSKRHRQGGQPSAACSSPSSASSTSRSSPSAAAKIPRTTRPSSPSPPSTSSTPKQLDYWITLKYDDPKNRALVEDELTELLRRRRKVANDKPDNFAIFGTDSLTRLWNKITGGLFLLLFALSSVALLVGGVGVMNIMLVSVTERTREIGIRKAIGATKRTILTQFTLEAMTLCAVGGIFGLSSAPRIAIGLRFLPPSEALARLGPRRLPQLLRHRSPLRHLPGLEGRQPQPHRSPPLRVVHPALRRWLSSR